MSIPLKPIRRVVTGNDAQGRSCVLFDSAAPNVNPRPDPPGTGMTDVWVYEAARRRSSGERDDGNLPFHFEPPHTAGICASCSRAAKPPGYDPAKDKAVPRTQPRQRRRAAPGSAAAQNLFTSPVHKSETVDYGILLDRRARAAARRRRARDEARRRRGADRQLARLVAIRDQGSQMAFV